MNEKLGRLRLEFERSRENKLDTLSDVDMNTSKDFSLPDEVKFVKLGNTTFEVHCNYVGTHSLLDVVKSGIRRDIELGDY